MQIHFGEIQQRHGPFRLNVEFLEHLIQKRQRNFLGNGKLDQWIFIDIKIKKNLRRRQYFRLYFGFHSQKGAHVRSDSDFLEQIEVQCDRRLQSFLQGCFRLERDLKGALFVQFAQLSVLIGEAACYLVKRDSHFHFAFGFKDQPKCALDFKRRCSQPRRKTSEFHFRVLGIQEFCRQFHAQKNARFHVDGHLIHTVTRHVNRDLQLHVVGSLERQSVFFIGKRELKLRGKASVIRGHGRDRRPDGYIHSVLPLRLVPVRLHRAQKREKFDQLQRVFRHDALKLDRLFPERALVHGQHNTALPDVVFGKYHRLSHLDRGRRFVPGHDQAICAVRELLKRILRDVFQRIGHHAGRIPERFVRRSVVQYIPVFDHL